MQFLLVLSVFAAVVMSFVFLLIFSSHIYFRFCHPVHFRFRNRWVDCTNDKLDYLHVSFDHRVAQ